MRLFRHKKEVPPEIQKARETVDAAEQATTEASEAVKKYWSIRKQYAKAEVQRRRK